MLGVIKLLATNIAIVMSSFSESMSVVLSRSSWFMIKSERYFALPTLCEIGRRTMGLFFGD